MTNGFVLRQRIPWLWRLKSIRQVRGTRVLTNSLPPQCFFEKFSLRKSGGGGGGGNCSHCGQIFSFGVRSALYLLSYLATWKCAYNCLCPLFFHSSIGSVEHFHAIRLSDGGAHSSSRRASLPYPTRSWRASRWRASLHWWTGGASLCWPAPGSGTRQSWLGRRTSQRWHRWTQGRPLRWSSWKKQRQWGYEGHWRNWRLNQEETHKYVKHDTGKNNLFTKYVFFRVKGDYFQVNTKQNNPQNLMIQLQNWFPAG